MTVPDQTATTKPLSRPPARFATPMTGRSRTPATRNRGLRSQFWVLTILAAPAVGGGTSTPEPFVLLDRSEVTGSPQSILSADFDNDGDTDLFVFNKFGFGSLMVNDGQAGFTEAPGTIVGQEGRMTADTGDIDADGDTDMIVGDRLLINDGSGGFVSSFFGPATVRLDLVKLVDMDNDGLLDIACVDIDNRKVGVYLNNGGLSFTLAGSSASDGVFNNQITAADFDADGDQDLFAVNTFSSFISLFRNDGSGNIGSNETIALPSGATALAIADVDGTDGPDLVIALGTLNSSSVALVANSGDGTFKPAVILFPFLNATDLKIADLDDDADQDIVVAGPSGVRVALNNGSGQFDATIPAIDVNGEPTGLAVADLDGDGDPEITTVNPDDSADCTVLPFNFDVYLNRFRNQPVVAESPAGVLATTGETAVLTVTLGLGHGPFSFQWFRDGQPIFDGDGVSGTATGALTITGVQPEDVGLYELEIGNDLGFVRTPPTVLGVRPDPDACFPDVNADGRLDFFDISRFIVEFGRGCP